MINGIQGKFFSFSASAAPTDDIISMAEGLTGDSILAKRFEAYSSGSFAFSINGGSESLPYLDTDGIYKLILKDGDVYISSFVLTDTSGCPTHYLMIYQ